MNQNSDIEGEQIKFEMAEDLVKAQEMNEEVEPRTAPVLESSF